VPDADPSIGGLALLPLGILLPLAGALLIGLSGRFANLREGITLLTAGLLAALVWSLLPHVLDGGRPECSFGEFVPGFAFVLRLEPFGMLFALVASTLWIVNSIYSIGYMRKTKATHQTRFFVFFALSISAAIGVAFAGNLLTLFFCYEMLTLATYPLVSHLGGDKVVASARVYLGILLATSIGLFLPAVLWTAQLAGTLDFVPGGTLAGKIEGPLVGLLLAMFVFGIGKAAVMPVHDWLPSAMVAPTPVSALLHAVAVVKAGVFSLTKVVVYVFGVDFLAAQPSADWFPLVAAFTVLAASVVAMRQNNLKRMLAFSTISQLSYVVLATAVLTRSSEIGAMLHVAAHACGKITLFFAAGAVYAAARKTEIDQLDGIARRMPWTAVAFTIAALSMIGVPPTAGFVSKWYMLLGTFEAENRIALVTIVLSTGLNAAYFLPVVHRMWFRKESVAPKNEHREAPWPMVAALTTTAVMTVALFFFHAPLVTLLRQIFGGTP
jgi:multicomponent Na+:H+ antiporter subunit D